MTSSGPTECVRPRADATPHPARSPGGVGVATPHPARPPAGGRAVPLPPWGEGQGKNASAGKWFYPSPLGGRGVGRASGRG